MVMTGQMVTGHLTGSAHDTEEAVLFDVTSGVLSMIERMPLTQGNEAVDLIRAGKPRFRIALYTEAG